MHLHLKSTAVLSLALAATSFAFVKFDRTVVASTDSTVPVQILGINDFHGNIATTNTAHMPNGNKIHNTGTAALLAGYLNQESSQFKQANPNGVSLRVESGDMIGASPAQSSLIYDQPTEAALNAMHIQVGTLGNHEFDKGLTSFNKVLNGQNPIANDNSTAAQFYKEYSQQALSGNYQLVISNVVNKSDGRIPNGWQPYTILSQKTANGQTVKIGVIGVITTDTSEIVTAKNVAPYTFLDPATQIEKYSKVLQAQGVHSIIVLGHTASDNVNDDPTQPVEGETANIINKLDQVDPNNDVDLYVAGHSHSFTDGVVGKTQVVQALSFGEAFDDITASYDVAKGTMTIKPNDANIVPVDPTKGVTPDPTVAAIVKNASALTDKIANQPIGQLASGTSLLSTTQSKLGESQLGDFITQAQLNTAKQNGITADFAMTNDGGIRTDLIGDSKGNLTWGAAEATQPFQDTVEVVSMTGQQVKDVLNQQTFASQVPGGSQYYLQEYGIKYTVTDNPNVKNDPSHPYVVAKMTKLDGSPISLTAKYNVVINDYIQAGGDGFTAFESSPVLAGFQDTDTNVLINYIEGLTAKGQKVPTSFPVEKSYESAADLNKTISVNYDAHVQRQGWQAYVKNGAQAGTTGQSLRMEAARITVSNLPTGLSGGIEYEAHVQRQGWQKWQSNGAIAGTTGQALREEAIKIKLTGALAQKYDVEYRAHVQNKGWLPWVKDGAQAGTTGQSLRMEALEVKLVAK